MQQTDFITAIKKGDRVVLSRMYTTIFPAIRKLVCDYGGSQDDAKDVFQDATIVIYEKAQKPDFQLTSQFSTFFIGISRNLWMSRRQKKSASEVTIPEDAKYMAEDSPDIDKIQVERGKVFYRALRQLGDDCQKLLELFFQKNSMEDIAQEMGYASEGYARRRKSQCKDRLVELVKNAPEYAELQNI